MGGGCAVAASVTHFEGWMCGLKGLCKCVFGFLKCVFNCFEVLKILYDMIERMKIRRRMGRDGGVYRLWEWAAEGRMQGDGML
jgi:hypothetical protein